MLPVSVCVADRLQHPRAGDHYQCSAAANNAPHVLCSYCTHAFPARDWPGTACHGCARSSCHAYFGDCTAGETLRKLRAHTMPMLPQGAVLGIRSETDLLQSYLDRNHVTPQAAWRCDGLASLFLFAVTDAARSACVQKLEAGTYKSAKWPNATADTFFCGGCAIMVQRELLLEYRRAIPEADMGPKRPDCHWGMSCRTAAHNDQHALRFNHVCPQTRFE